MKGRRLVPLVAGVAVVIAGATTPIVVALAAGTPNVTTAGYNNLRDSWDPDEPALSPSVIQSASFGKVFSTKVDGAIYAQPLVENGTVIVTTEKARAYGINATTGAVEWSRSFGTPFKASTIGCSDLTPYIGSTSTPVVDPATGLAYLTTRLEVGGSKLADAHWFLQALSSSTGSEAPGFPVEITGSPSNTPGVPFDDAYSMQRPGLLLLNGTVYMAFASDCDFTPYRGIVAGVSTTTHAITTMWSDESGIGTDQNSQAGIWQSGAGIVSDESNQIVLTTGNGVSPQAAPSDHPPATLSESVLALRIGGNGGLSPTQFFAPSNAANLDANDDDLGSGGPIGLPAPYFGTTSVPNLLVQQGKDGRIFLINADNMGGFDQGTGGTDAVLQMLGPFEGEWGHPAAYGGQGGWVYFLESAGGPLRAFSYGLNGQDQPQLTPSGASALSFGYTSGSPVVTSNGTAAGSAVVWGVATQGSTGTGGRLVAYGAIPSGGVLPLLWSAPIGRASKFTVPTAWNGRVYVGNRDGRLFAFGASTNAPLQAASVDFGSVPVGASQTRRVSASTPHGLTITGPVTATGYEGATGPEPAATGGAGAGSTTGTVTSTTLATAGPTIPPPTEATPLAGRVLTVRQPAPGTTFGPGATVPLQVTFTPTRPGPIVANLSIPTNAGTETVAVSGYGSAPGLVTSAQPLAYGAVETGAGGRSLTISFSNSWDHPEVLTGATLPGAPYSVHGFPPIGTVLAPQQSVTVSVAFNPSVAGSYPSGLRISTGHGSASLPITGTAVTGTARLAVSSTDIVVGTVPIGHSVNVTFDVSNSGTVALVITRAIAPSGEFSAAVPMPAGTTIGPGTELHQTVTFRPTVAGPASSAYIFNADTGQGYVTVTLNGTGA
ncbi:MAG: choice-of-anchor D domain-containing protein [Acidimicrobiales bacterium]